MQAFYSYKMETERNKDTESKQMDDYISLMDNVLSQSQDLFVTEGVDKNVIDRLRAIWLSKFESSKSVHQDNPNLKPNISEGASCSVKNSLSTKFKSNMSLNSVLPLQIDGALDSSDDENGPSSDDAVSDDNDEDKDPDDHDMDDGGPEEEPLGSGDDITDEEDPSDLFDTDNVIVCQYEKITRIRNKWKFHLKYGIMNLNGEDYVFQKADGDAEW